jgi:RND family efflux transporter MFP subunit
MKYSSLLLPLLLTGLLFACGKKEKTADSSAKPALGTPVKVAEVGREEISAPIQLAGIVSASNEARPAFKTGGVIARILVEEGQFVKKGQLLATLNLTEINAQVQQAQEGVAKSKRDLQRAQNLYADSVATLEQVQNATTGLSIAEQSLQMARFNQSYSEIRSPISGKVVKKIMNEGEVVGPGSPVFYILSAADADWVIKGGLADRDWARLTLGDRCEVSLDAYPGKTFTAKVSQLADVGNPQSGTFDAEFDFVGNTPRLAVGLVAMLKAYPKKQGPQAVIPVEAIVESNGSSAVVFALNEDLTVRRLEVTVGPLFADKIVILAGLDGVQKVVTAGAPYLEDGMKVRTIQ